MPYTCINISGGISRNSTKYCNAGEIVVVTNFWMHRINRSISMVILIEVRAIISMSLILWYNFAKCHSPTSISSADLFYFHWMTLTSSQIDTFHISRVFHRLVANKTPSSESFIFQMWLPSPCSSSGKSRSQRRQVPPMEAGRWTTLWMVHWAAGHESPERRWVLSYHERILLSSLDHVWKAWCDFSLTLWPGHARIVMKGRCSNNQPTRCIQECLRCATK